MANALTHRVASQWLEVARWPSRVGIDLVRRVRPDAADGLEIAFDRFDAATRELVGRALRDEELIEDARRRRVAADQRTTAQEKRLQAEAEREKAERTRQQAEASAAARSEQAERQREQRKQEAARKEHERKASAARVAGKVESAIESRDRKARLETLDREVDALDERKKAATEAQRATQLRKATSAAKAARKRN